MAAEREREREHDHRRAGAPCASCGTMSALRRLVLRERALQEEAREQRPEPEVDDHPDQEERRVQVRRLVVQEVVGVDLRVVGPVVERRALPMQHGDHDRQRQARPSSGAFCAKISARRRTTMLQCAFTRCCSVTQNSAPRLDREHHHERHQVASEKRLKPSPCERAETAAMPSATTRDAGARRTALALVAEADAVGEAGNRRLLRGVVAASGEARELGCGSAGVARLLGSFAGFLAGAVALAGPSWRLPSAILGCAT